MLRLGGEAKANTSLGSRPPPLMWLLPHPAGHSMGEKAERERLEPVRVHWLAAAARKVSFKADM